MYFYTHLFKKKSMYIMETFHATEFLMWEEAVLFIEPTPHHGEKLQVISYKKYNIFIFPFEKRFF